MGITNAWINRSASIEWATIDCRQTERLFMVAELNSVQLTLFHSLELFSSQYGAHYGQKRQIALTVVVVVVRR